MSDKCKDIFEILDGGVKFCLEQDSSILIMVDTNH